MSQPRTVGELQLVVIWSDEHRQWWRPDGLGYTPRIEEAGLFDAEEASKRWIHNNEYHHAVRLAAVAPRRRRGSSQ